MRFGVTAEQKSFAEALEDLLGGSDVPTAARDWAAGSHERGLTLWRRLAELGVTALAVPEDLGGMGASEADLAVAFEALGYAAAPGPWIETVALASRLISDPDALEGITSGDALVSVSTTGRAADADVAAETLVLNGTTLSRAVIGASRTSIDPARHLVDVTAGEVVAELDQKLVERALNSAYLAAAAMALGAGERMLSISVEYAKQRQQFGTIIGEYQALKHLLADVRVALDFARPLVHLAALSLDAGSADADRDVSAAAVACLEAAHLASRTSLQVHGAIGYTQECDLSLWLLKSRALRTAWGTPDFHRRRVLAALVEGR